MFKPSDSYYNLRLKPIQKYLKVPGGPFKKPHLLSRNTKLINFFNESLWSQSLNSDSLISVLVVILEIIAMLIIFEEL